jgi:hypothetical protein
MLRRRFGDFSVSVDPSTGRFLALYCGPAPVPLGDVSLSVLEFLARHAPLPVPGKTIAAALWPVHADDSNVGHQIAAIRRALCDYPPHRYVRTIGKQGYCLAVPLSAPDACPLPILPSALPTGMGRHVYGRRGVTAAILRAWRRPSPNILVLYGEGGIGKTVLAAEIARYLRSRSPIRYLEHSFDPGHRALAPGAESSWTLPGWLENLEPCGTAASVPAPRTLAILDGFEAAQWPVGDPREGGVKDEILRNFLRALATLPALPRFLLLITTRTPLSGLRCFEGAGVLSLPLDSLDPQSGACIFQEHGVWGDAIGGIVAAYGGHPLALHIVAEILASAYRGDSRRWHEFGAISADPRYGWQVRKALDSYVHCHPPGSPEIGFLEALAVHRRPVSLNDLLITTPRSLSDRAPQPLEPPDLAALRRARLAFETPSGDRWDCHPLVRDYFSDRLFRRDPGVWRTAHRVIFDRLAASLSGPVSSPAEADALLEAIHHGSAASALPAALDLYRRCGFTAAHDQYRQANVCRRFGLMAQEAAALFGFFDGAWETVSPVLPLSDRVFVARETASRLRWSGRLRDARRVFAGLLADPAVDLPARVIANRYAAEISLVLGDLAEAVSLADWGLTLSPEGADPIARVALHTIHGLCAAYSAQPDESLRRFGCAERIMAAAFPRAPALCSLSALRLWEVLAWYGRWDLIAERVRVVLAARASDALPVTLGIVEDGIYGLFEALSDPQPGRDLPATFARCARALDAVRQSGRREIHVKCLILFAHWALSRSLALGQARLALEEAAAEADACELAFMRLDAEAGLLRFSLLSADDAAPRRRAAGLAAECAAAGYLLRARQVESLPWRS